jgi:hypothetical protein
MVTGSSFKDERSERNVSDVFGQLVNLPLKIISRSPMVPVWHDRCSVPHVRSLHTRVRDVRDKRPSELRDW